MDWPHPLGPFIALLTPPYLYPLGGSVGQGRILLARLTCCV